MKESQANEVAFFGKITAGFTHELKNVLAIIKESSGLMEDLLMMSKDAPFPHTERFFRTLSIIKAQVNRGVNLSTRLNRFAHCPDEPVAAVDLNGVLDQVSVLSERFARAKDVTLKPEIGVDPVTVTTSAVKLHLAIFKAMECCWNSMGPGGEIKLRAENRGDGGVCAFIHFSNPGDERPHRELLSGSPDWEVLCDITAMIGGRVEWGKSDAEIQILLPRDIKTA